MYNEVANWLNNVLNQDIPEEVVAFSSIYMKMEIMHGRWNWMEEC